MPHCKFCSKEIFWLKEGRRSKANNMDGSDHKCEELKKTMESTKSIPRSSLSAEDIAAYEARMNAKVASTLKKK